MVWFKNIVNPCKPKNIIASSTECESVQVWGRCKCGVGASVGSVQVWGRRKCGVGASVGVGGGLMTRLLFLMLKSSNKQ